MAGYINRQRITRIDQIRIYTGKCFRIFFHDKGWKALLSAAILSAIISWVIGSDTFVFYEKTEKGMFAMVCGCLWTGLFNSIQSICRERPILKREHRTGLHMSSYVAAHMVYEFAICMMQAVIIAFVFLLIRRNEVPAEGVLFPFFAIELFIDFTLIIFCADALGLMVSSIVHTPNAAMMVMPFVLIFQLVLSGMLFTLDPEVSFIENITIGKFGLEALCTSTDINAIEFLAAKNMDFMFNYPPAVKLGYVATAKNLFRIWGILISFSLLYGLIGIISLEFIDRDKR